MTPDKSHLEQQVIAGTIELMEIIANNKTTAVTLENGQVFYRTESHVLKLVGDEPGIFSSEIARRFGVTRAAVQKVLSRLAARGLINRLVDQTDKKRIRLHLTAAGRQALEGLVQYQTEINAAFFSAVSAMTPEELSTVGRFLSTARGVLEKMHGTE